MKNKPIWLKSVISGIIYIVFSLLIIFFVYIIDVFESTFVLGAIYGGILAFITSCDGIKRTVIARIMGIIAAFIAQVILFILGIPYQIILFILRDNEWVRETGRLTVNEVIGYNWGTMFFWWVMLISFAGFVIGIFVFNVVRSRIKKPNTGGNVNESE